MDIILGNVKDYDEEVCKWLNYIDDNDYYFMALFLLSVDESKLYSSKIHGIYHSEKVLLYSLIIGKMKNLSKEDLTILFLAAYYHDMGRNSDFEDEFHGYVAAKEIEECVTKTFTGENKDNLNILKALVDSHASPDYKRNVQVYYYEVLDIERFERLYQILKDADALDRKRFQESCNASLDESYLRTEEARRLIAFAEGINKFYYQEMERRRALDLNIEDESSHDCFHSIGFDFFRIPSILNFGILSLKEMEKRKIEFPRNFEGGNGYNWISVVDPRGFENKQDNKAFRTFIMEGISFYCMVPKLQEPMDFNDKYKALEEGLPFDKGGYHDEKFVYRHIPSNDIISVIVPEKYKNISIRNLDYIYNSFSKDIMKNRVKYYFKQTKRPGEMEDCSSVMAPLNTYCRLLEYYESLTVSERAVLIQKYPVLLEQERQEINKCIQKWIYKYYKERLGIKTITVSDVVSYELKQANFDYSLIGSDQEEIYLLPTRKERDTKLVNDWANKQFTEKGKVMKKELQS